MLVKIDSKIDIDKIIESWIEADQYDQLGLIGQSEKDGILEIFNALKDKDMTLMEILQESQSACSTMFVSFMPIQQKYIYGQGVVKLINPTLLFIFSEIPTDLALVELNGYYLITMDCVNVP